MADQKMHAHRQTCRWLSTRTHKRALCLKTHVRQVAGRVLTFTIQSTAPSAVGWPTSRANRLDQMTIYVYMCANITYCFVYVSDSVIVFVEYSTELRLYYENIHCHRRTELLNICSVFVFYILFVIKMPHDHDHDHGHGCSHEATDVDNALELGIQYSLFKKIDMENLECLNEESEGSGKTVFKPYELRLDFSTVIWNAFIAI